MKNKIENVYNDGYNLFTDNQYIQNDERLTRFTDLLPDLDLITQFSYGTREIFKRYLQNDDTEVYVYDLSQLKKATYACIVKNLDSYLVLLNADESVLEIDPTAQFSKTTVYGQQQNTNAYGRKEGSTTYGVRSTEDSYGVRVNTTTHGTKTITDAIGSATDTVSNGARTTTGAVTSFSSSTFNDTEKATENAVIDTTQYGAHTDTRQETQLDDTLSEGAHIDNHKTSQTIDTTTTGSHTDTLTSGTHTDTVTGYNDGVEHIEKYRRYANHNTLNEITNDVVNMLTYNMYLFKGV